jgi:hypothetical protein
VENSGKKKKKRLYDSGSSPTALKQGAATYRHVFFALRYAMCIRKHARFLLLFCVGTTQQAGTAVKKSNSVRHILRLNLDRAINYIDPCISSIHDKRRDSAWTCPKSPPCSSFLIHQLSYHLAL